MVFACIRMFFKRGNHANRPRPDRVHRGCLQPAGLTPRRENHSQEVCKRPSGSRKIVALPFSLTLGHHPSLWTSVRLACTSLSSRCIPAAVLFKNSTHPTRRNTSLNIIQNILFQQILLVLLEILSYNRSILVREEDWP